MFGGPWTQQKLEVLSKYLSAYTKIFTKNPKAQFYTTSYVDAFAGTGVIRRPALGGFASFFPELAKADEEFRKGSVRRALEVEPPFDKYVFIEKSAKKCKELKAVAEEFPKKKVDVINEDANSALLKWCSKLNTERERAVVFLVPFGASVEWKVVSALAKTRATSISPAIVALPTFR
jgi:three-Cys-motif partner protein